MTKFYGKEELNQIAIKLIANEIGLYADACDSIAYMDGIVSMLSVIDNSYPSKKDVAPIAMKVIHDSIEAGSEYPDSSRISFVEGVSAFYDALEEQTDENV